MQTLKQRFYSIVKPGKVARSALILAGALGLTALATQFGVATQATTAKADGSLYYRPGYTVEGPWLCYGWNTGAYHCTHWWHVANGSYVSDNPAWVPNYSNYQAPAQQAPAQQAPAQQAPAQQAPAQQAPAQQAAPSNNAGGSVADQIRSTFGPYAGQALAVASCESSLNPSATNRSSDAEGVFQFLASTWAGTSYAGYSRYNASANIQAAHEVFVRDGYSWREWSCQP